VSFSAASSRAINRTMKSNFNCRHDSSVCSWNPAKICGIALVHSFWTAGIMMAGSATSSNYELKPLSLPGATGVVTLDYFAYDRSTGKLWVPASNTGNVDVIDESSDAVSQVTGFKTGEVELRGRKVALGPTAVTIGDGVVYIGNRGDSTLCIIDAHTLGRGKCLQVAPTSAGPAAAPDGVVYVAARRELWITTGAPPLGIASADKSIQVFDASDPRQLKPKTKIPLNGSAEGYAVDNQRGLFYTNIEETGRTAAIDVRSHKLVAAWNAGSTELQGLALDSGRGLLFVACGDHVVSLDVGPGSAIGNRGRNDIVMAKASPRERVLVGSERTLFAQQKQTGDGEHSADMSLPRRRFMKKQNPGDRHDRCANGHNCGNKRARPAFL